MFKFDNETIHGEVITAIWGENPRITNDGSFCCDRIALEIGNAVLEISANTDTDTLTVELKNAGQSLAGRLTDISTFLDAVGKPMGRARIAADERGCQDTLLLALEDNSSAAPGPAYLFVGIDSSISVYAVERVKRPAEFALSMPG